MNRENEKKIQEVTIKAHKILEKINAKEDYKQQVDDYIDSQKQLDAAGIDNNPFKDLIATIEKNYETHKQWLEILYKISKEIKKD